jgi:uncharacterized membrane protein
MLKSRDLTNHIMSVVKSLLAMKTDIKIDDLPELATRAELARIAVVSQQTIDNWALRGWLKNGQKQFTHKFWHKKDIIVALRRAGCLAEEIAAGKK